MAIDSVIQFPKSKKRGRKVTTGPRADVHQLEIPGHKLPVGPMWNLYIWLVSSIKDFDVERIEPTEEERRESVPLIADAGETPMSRKIRADVQRLQAKIRKRIAVKDWLETQGIDWDEIRDAEDALHFVYDRLAHGN